MFATRSKRLSTLAVVTAVAAACSDTGPGSMESVDVTMQHTDAILTQLVGGWYASVSGGEGSAVAIAKDTVASLKVRITDIQFLPKADEAQAANDGVWISLQLSAPVLLDLMALPTEGESPIVIASGTVPVGNYGDVRVFVDSAVIQFKGAIDLGVAFNFQGAPEEYQVGIPSVAETGIKTDAEFTVEADAAGDVNDVNLLFSPTATFLNVNATGEGQVILAPVIRSIGAP